MANAIPAAERTGHVNRYCLSLGAIQASYVARERRAQELDEPPVINGHDQVICFVVPPSWLPRRLPSQLRVFEVRDHQRDGDRYDEQETQVRERAQSDVVADVGERPAYERGAVRRGHPGVCQQRDAERGGTKLQAQALLSSFAA